MLLVSTQATEVQFLHPALGSCVSDTVPSESTACNLPQEPMMVRWSHQTNGTSKVLRPTAEVPGSEMGQLVPTSAGREAR
jgi:hypothetical protein